MRRHQSHTFIARLSYIVKASVIHNRWSSSVFLGKRSRTQRVYRIRIRCSEVMHQAQRMTYFMSGHIAQGTSHSLIIEHRFSYFRIYSSSLHETPVMQQFHHVRVEQHVALNDFSRTRVYARRAHGILLGSSNHTVATVTYIIGIKVGVVFRIILRHDSILESYFLEGFLPVFNSLFDILSPFFGNSRIYIIHYLLLWFYHLTILVSLQVFRLGLQVPTVNERKLLQSVFLFGKEVFTLIKVSYARIAITRTHSLLRQQNNVARHGYSKRISIYRITHQRLDVDVLRKTLHAQNIRL